MSDKTDKLKEAAAEAFRKWIAKLGAPPGADLEMLKIAYESGWATGASEGVGLLEARVVEHARIIEAAGYVITRTREE